METTPQTVRIMLDEPPPPTQVVALTEGDEAVAEAFGEVQKLEENLSKLNEQLKELDDKLAAGEDDAEEQPAEHPARDVEGIDPTLESSGGRRPPPTRHALTG